MFKYFDNTFFKFFFGFLGILSVSLAILLATRYYAGGDQTTTTIDSVPQQANQQGQ